MPILRDFGLDPDPVIREAGLDPRLFEDEPTSSPMPPWAGCSPCAWPARTARISGFWSASAPTILSLGMVGRLMQHSETVGRCHARPGVEPEHPEPGRRPVAHRGGDMALFTFSVYQAEAESADQISDGSLAVTVNAMRALCGSVEPDRGAAAPGLPRGCRSRIVAISALRSGSMRRAPSSSSRPAIWICGWPGPIPWCGLCWRSASSN